jgi:hypothetical protein
MRTERRIIQQLKNAPKIRADEGLYHILQMQIPQYMVSRRHSSALLFRRKTVQISLAAAVILFMVILGQSLIPFTGTAYEIGDLPGIFNRAKTLHITGQAFFPFEPERDGAQMRALNLDYWFDNENGSYRLRKPAGFDEQTGEPIYFTKVSDGRCFMEEVHFRPDTGENPNQVRFTLLSPYQAKLEAYRGSCLFLTRLLGSAERLIRAARERREEINGTTYDVWRNEWFEPDGKGTKLMVWLSRETGSVGRITFHTKASRDTAEWTPYLSLDRFEINVIPPVGIFGTEPPEGYGLLNTRENAPIGELGIGTAAYGCRDYGLFLHIGFTLRDGSVLAAWSCRGSENPVETEAFRNLEPGDPLPSLPAIISSLEPIPEITGLSYRGYHLLYTEKNGILYEWALYLPNRIPPERGSFLSYRTNITFSVDRRLFKTFPARLSDDLSIGTRIEFDTWVRGALTELSDCGKIPAGFTYESLMERIKKWNRH